MTTGDLLPDDWARDCEELAVTLAPEVLSPIYAMAMPAGYPASDDTAAFTSQGAMDFILRGTLIGSGRWRGPGIIVCFCLRMTRDEVLGLMVHEIAHELPYTPPPADFEPSKLLIAQQRACIAEYFSSPWRNSQLMPRWFDLHGADFVRRCLHLHRRAWVVGREIGLPEISFAGPQYDLSPAWMYMQALGDEPEQMLEATFAEIEQTTPPAEFLQLFADDFTKWLAERRNQTLEVKHGEVA